MRPQCWAVALLMAAIGVTQAAPAARFTFYGLAPALAGFDLPRAEAALGQPLTLEPGPARASAA